MSSAIKQKKMKGKNCMSPHCFFYIKIFEIAYSRDLGLIHGFNGLSGSLPFAHILCELPRLLCCFVVYFTRRFVVIFPCVILFLCFSVLLVSLGEERANLSAFRTFVLGFSLFSFFFFFFFFLITFTVRLPAPLWPCGHASWTITFVR